MQTIIQLLRQPAADQVLDPQTCLGWVRATNEAYRALHRPGMDGHAIVDIKLSTIFWRYRLLDHLLTQPPPWMAAQHDTAFSILTELNTRLSPHHWKLAAGLLDQHTLARIMARQGSATPAYPELDNESGPGVDLEIAPNRRSDVSYETWRENDLFSRYEYDQEGVRYRGMFFRPGDVLLANVNLDGNGIYTSLSEPRGFSSHSAFFAILEHHHKRFPVVIETYEKGVRPVPLSVFLGERFCSYVEIYRHNDYAADLAPEINQAAESFIKSVRGYNFDSEDKDRTYMSCTAIGRFMHQAAGLKPAQTISKMDHPQVQSNLAKVGYTHFDYFGPVDFLVNDCFHHEGFVDNNQINRLLARELIDRDLLQQFINHELDPNKFPFPYKLNRWGISQMRKQSLIGKAVSRANGFKVENLPKGSDEVLAAILLVEKQIGQAISKTRITVEEVVAEHDHLDMDALTADERLREAVRQNLYLPWLRPVGG